MTGAADELGVGHCVSLDRLESVELCAALREWLFADGAKSMLAFADLFFEFSAVGGCATLVELEALGDVPSHLMNEIAVLSR